MRQDEVEQRVDELQSRTEKNPYLQELAKRPLLLTLISTLHASGGKLPEDRAELYRDSLELLLYHWREPHLFRNDQGQSVRLDTGALRKSLENLAFKVHKLQRQKNQSGSTADISRDVLLESFDPLLESVGRRDLLDYLQQHAGVLIARDEDNYSFPHRSFQEFLAMRWLTGQPDLRLIAEIREDPLWWREVFLLAVTEQRHKPHFAMSYIGHLLQKGESKASQQRHQQFVLAGMALIELGLTGFANEDFQRQRDEIRKGLIGLIEDAAALDRIQRAEAGRTLGNIGDPRPGVGINDNELPDIDWAPIPGGEVILKEADFRRKVESFHMARYPVTNSQFQAFVDAPDGYGNMHWWLDLEEQPESPQPGKWKEPNHPREMVSWCEAVAFCRWLSGRLGFEVRLPSEFEWERAAAGPERSNYPWGDNYHLASANVDERGFDSEGEKVYLGRTTAVGLYPSGASCEGVVDLAGNVWEWCLNKFDNPNDLSIKGSAWRVVRGGSWMRSPDNARASCRNGCVPGSRGNNLVFRVCCPSPIP